MAGISMDSMKNIVRGYLAPQVEILGVEMLSAFLSASGEDWKVIEDFYELDDYNDFEHI